MIVIDVELTGVDPLKHSLVSVGAIDMNDPERGFYGECRIFEGAHVEDEALEINGFTYEEITAPNKVSDGELVEEFISWVSVSGDHTFAGLNHHLDLYFMDQAAKRYHIDFSWPKRLIDLHTACWMHMTKSGITPPIKKRRTDLDSRKIYEYVGIPNEPHPHIALNGAKWEAESLHRLFYEKPLFAEFEEYPVRLIA